MSKDLFPKLCRQETLKIAINYVLVLSHSRKGYSQAVLHQDTESFLRCQENGFRHFGEMRSVHGSRQIDCLPAGWDDDFRFGHLLR